MTLHDAMRFAHSMHDGVEDWTGLPYITHPVWVMLSLPAECTDEDRQIALLHDVFEDCQERLCREFTVPWVAKKDIGMLNELFLKFRGIGYSEYVETGIRLLTRDLYPYLTYLNYIRNIVSSGRRGVMWIKYSDNCHNTDPSRFERLPPERKTIHMEMQPRYEISKAILRSGLGI